jgi:hypothetical protein
VTRDDDAAPALPVGSALPPLDRPLGDLDFPLRRTATPDDDRRYTLLGAGARVDGDTTAGPEVAIGGIRALCRLHVRGARPRSGVVTPLGAERRLAVDGAPVTERAVVPRTGPFAFLEWSAGGDLGLALAWSVETGGPARWQADGRGLGIRTAGAGLLFAFSEPAEWRVREAGDRLEVGAAVRVPARGGVRLAIAEVGGQGPPPAALRRMSRAHLAGSARLAEARRVREEGLRVRTGDPAMDEALAWDAMAAAGLVGAPDRDPYGLGDALVALLAGEHRRARAGLETLGRRAEEGRGAAGYLFLLGRYLAWTGDRNVVRGHWGRVGRLLGSLDAGADADADPGPAGTDADAACWRAARRALARAAEEVGDDGLASRLGGKVEAAPAPGPACWPGGAEESAAAAVVHGILGVDPDAPRGRVALRPRIPEDTDRFELRGLTVGGAAVELDYDRTDTIHWFTLRQTRGAAPLQVVLEPELAGRRVARARVDGQPAELDPVPAQGRFRVPVQVVLDHERRVVVEMEPGSQ